MEVEPYNKSGTVVWIDEEGKRHVATMNLAPGVRVYGEKLVEVGGKEYRIWDPYRSKLCASVLRGLRSFPFEEGKRVLYLGASTGTTLSHVSDAICESGIVFGVEFAPRVASEFIERCVKHRSNVIPVIQDARKPERYIGVFGKVDVVYCDVAQPDEVEIVMNNSELYLKRNGHMFLAVKSRSIDVAKKPREVYKEAVEKLGSIFEILEVINLEPFDKDHAMIVGKRK